MAFKKYSDKFPSRRNGFTLIELLIVIAIILILIAIGLPNFLEARTRGKITKAQGELRSLGTAAEAYASDYQVYPLDGDDIAPFNPANFAVLDRLEVLTTPREYLTELPVDPFHQEGLVFIGSDALFPGLAPYTYAYNTKGSFGGFTDLPDNQGKPDNYALTSMGPSRTFDSVTALCPLMYSPTNGTTSLGDIIRLGGSRSEIEIICPLP